MKPRKEQMLRLLDAPSDDSVRGCAASRTALTDAAWDNETGHWTVETQAGSFTADEAKALAGRLTSGAAKLEVEAVP